MVESSTDRVAIAALFAALVEALDEQSDGVALSFARHLQAIQGKLSAAGADIATIETLARTRALLREELDREEPAYVVYAKRLAGTEDMLPSSDKIPLPTLDEAVTFWSRLPTFDRETASIETASGHRFAAAEISALHQRMKEETLQSR